ncbi:6,7-dimethyl-8-ribityllumazine synthase [Candidatus Peregrinibacteria bacterium]|jgi:6,7-dimethyl-8-ribityllumazine synthase|nr:6,7-dimethyl-8-ribityllumazine synthase [Candidatus Peregrinibacteria bacterium]MBT4056412.1 6,7-dimethyl-8-ribityllumazine synthase [Candidatus Peregrinibacteria bacterium]
MEINPEKTQDTQVPEENNIKVSILLPYFNDELGTELHQNTVDALHQFKIKPENITLTRTPGALELPFTAQQIIKKDSPDVVIALGIIIKGETSHYKHVCGETYSGLMNVQLKTETPIIFGVLTCKTIEQAKERCSKNGLNKGRSCAEAAIIQAQVNF